MEDELNVIFVIVAVLFMSTAVGWWRVGVANADVENGVEKEVLPPNKLNFLTGRWHPAQECVQCHVSLLTTDELRAKLGSCNCHYTEYTTAGNIDMQKIRENAHGIKICVDCHIGTGLVDVTNISSDKFHRAHQDVRCESCHLKENSAEPFVPEQDECDACHSRDPHMTHGAKTADLCVVCHGAFGEEYKRKGVMHPGGAVNETAESATAFPTVSEIFKHLLSRIADILDLRAAG